MYNSVEIRWASALNETAKAGIHPVVWSKIEVLSATISIIMLLSISLIDIHGIYFIMMEQIQDDIHITTS